MFAHAYTVLYFKRQRTGLHIPVITIVIVIVKVAQSCPTLQMNGLHSPWNSPGQNTRVGSHSLLQGIFPIQGSNPGLPHCRQILYQLNYQGSPNINKSITREGSNFHQYSFPSFLILNFNFFTVRSFCVQLFYPPEVEVLSPWPDVFLGKAVENGSTMVLFF